MKSVAVFALDFFESSTIPVSAWLGDDVPNHGEYLRACVAYAQNPHAEEPLRCEPRVAYDVLHDASYFIFKQDNNGTCILVGDSLPHLPADALVDGNAGDDWEMT